MCCQMVKGCFLVVLQQFLFDVGFYVFVDFVKKQQCNCYQEWQGIVYVYGQVDVIYYGLGLLFEVGCVIVVCEDVGDQCVVDVQFYFQFVQYCGEDDCGGVVMVFLFGVVCDVGDYCLQ